MECDAMKNGTRGDGKARDGAGDVLLQMGRNEMFWSQDVLLLLLAYRLGLRDVKKGEQTCQVAHRDLCRALRVQAKEEVFKEEQALEESTVLPLRRLLA
jgi:hypothetical protein